MLKIERGPQGLDADKPLAEQMEDARAAEGDLDLEMERKAAKARTLKKLLTTPEGQSLIEHWDKLNKNQSQEPLLPLSVKGLSQDEVLILYMDYELKKNPNLKKEDIPDMHLLYKQSKVHVLNNEIPGSWEKIDKSVRFPHRNQDQAVTSTITPLGTGKGKGVCSGDRLTQTSNIPNLAKTRVSYTRLTLPTKRIV